jgi:phage gp29-like protein
MDLFEANDMDEKLKKEIASTQDGRDITRGYVDALPLLPPQDRLLQLKGGGDLMIYQEVMRDEQVKACFGQRTEAVVSRPWEVRPGGKMRRDIQAAKFIEEQVKQLNWDDITKKMLSGVFYGYAVAEALWKQDGSFIVFDMDRKGIKVRDRRRFGYAPDMSLRLKTSKSPLGEPVPDKKFWSFCTGADHDDEPYGLGLAHWLYWPVFFKRNGIQFWLTFLEKFGTPTVKGEYPEGTPETEQNKLLDALRSIRRDSAFVVPQGMTAELLEATRGGTADYTSLYDRMDAAIARATLGQTASTQGTPGRLGNDDLQGDVRMDIVKADADLVCMSFNGTFVRWLTEWNFPGAALPQLWRIIEDPEDLDALAERDKKITEMGYKPTLKHIMDKYGGEWTEKTETPPPAVVPGAPGANSSETPPAEFAEGEHPFPDQQALDDLIAGLPSATMQAQMEALLQPVIDIVQKSGNYEEALGKLAEAWPEMDGSKLEQLLTQAFYAAGAWGVISARDKNA